MHLVEGIDGNIVKYARAVEVSIAVNIHRNSSLDDDNGYPAVQGDIVNVARLGADEIIRGVPRSRLAPGCDHICGDITISLIGDCADTHGHLVGLGIEHHKRVALFAIGLELLEGTIGTLGLVSWDVKDLLGNRPLLVPVFHIDPEPNGLGLSCRIRIYIFHDPSRRRVKWRSDIFNFISRGWLEILEDIREQNDGHHHDDQGNYI